MGRIGLFLATNFAVVAVLTIVLNLLGFNQPGANMTPMLVMAAVMGMGGSFISLLMSKTMAIRSMGASIITNPSSPGEQWLVATVKRQAERLNIGMPDVAVFNSATPNAFATGSDKNHALVAVSTGLLETMEQDEVEAVLGHEMAHVANGDMVTLTLIQGVLNTFVMVFASILASVLDRGNRGGRGMGYYLGYVIAQSLLGFLASLIVFWFSRRREFRADIGGAELAGRHKMIAALQRLQSTSRQAPLPGGLAAFGISSGKVSALGRLLMTHPPLEERIAALQAGSAR
jgi:heat shock protein HtpX